MHSKKEKERKEKDHDIIIGIFKQVENEELTRVAGGMAVRNRKTLGKIWRRR